MYITLRIKITVGHHRQCRKSIKERIKRLENTVASIDPVKQIMETLDKESRDIRDTAYEF